MELVRYARTIDGNFFLSIISRVEGVQSTAYSARTCDGNLPESFQLQELTMFYGVTIIENEVLQPH